KNHKTHVRPIPKVQNHKDIRRIHYHPLSPQFRRPLFSIVRFIGNRVFAYIIPSDFLRLYFSPTFPPLPARDTSGDITNFKCHLLPNKDLLSDWTTAPPIQV